jgi:hypothetical protein
LDQISKCHLAKDCQLPKKNKGRSQQYNCPKEYILMCLNLSVCNKQGNPTKDWILDSGATSSMCWDRNLFNDFTEISRKVWFADSKYAMALGIGPVSLEYEVQGQRVTRIIQDILYVPGFMYNLLSEAKLLEKGLVIQKDTNRTIITKHNLIILKAIRNA